MMDFLNEYLAQVTNRYAFGVSSSTVCINCGARTPTERLLSLSMQSFRTFFKTSFQLHQVPSCSWTGNCRNHTSAKAHEISLEKSCISHFQEVVNEPTVYPSAQTALDGAASRIACTLASHKGCIVSMYCAGIYKGPRAPFVGHLCQRKTAKRMVTPRAVNQEGRTGQLFRRMVTSKISKI